MPFDHVSIWPRLLLSTLILLALLWLALARGSADERTDPVSMLLAPAVPLLPDCPPCTPGVQDVYSSIHSKHVQGRITPIA